jgi:hypothetical protein
MGIGKGMATIQDHDHHHNSQDEMKLMVRISFESDPYEGGTALGAGGGAAAEYDDEENDDGALTTALYWPHTPSWYLQNSAGLLEEQPRLLLPPQLQHANATHKEVINSHKHYDPRNTRRRRKSGSY